MGIGLPHIAAGDNLNMPGVGWVLRHNGAFFIRREWGGDRLYVTIMQEYVEYLLNKGYNIEAFIEGTRSRTGKLLQPKFGFLKLILESILKGKTSDAILIPVSIGYDKVIETPSYVNELLGTPKQKESIGQLLNSINLLQLRWGRIDVRFGEAFSMSDFAQKLIASGKSGIQRMNLTDQSDINRISVIMPTALVGTVLLTLRGRGVGRNELIRRVGKLKSWIIARGGQVAESGASDASVIVDRVYYPLKRFELTILSVAMYATLKVGGPIRAQRIPIKTVLFKDVQFVSQLLKFEFVYDAGGLEQNLDATLNQLVSANVAVIGKEEEENPSNGGKPGDLWVTLSAEERRTGRETFGIFL
ncbi:hypothetical protein HDV02_000448 [Globomyces sp. JEL0801]|nr:hypothetical protein HDV02_000448 [Globomyces sp. JEL0801]